MTRLNFGRPRGKGRSGGYHIPIPTGAGRAAQQAELSRRSCKASHTELSGEISSSSRIGNGSFCVAGQ
jgi:hypothetical protein